MSLALEGFAKSAFEALEPLDRGLHSPAQLGILLRRVGVHVDFPLEALEALIEPLAILAMRTSSALLAGRDAISRIDDETLAVSDRALAVLDLLAIVGDLVQVAKDIGPTMQALDLGDLPAPIAEVSWDTDVAKQLPEYLLLSWLEDHRPIIFGLLHTLEVIRTDPLELALDALGDMVRNPLARLKSIYGWEEQEQPLAVERLFERLAAWLSALGAPVRFRSIRPEFTSEFMDRTRFLGLDVPLVDGFLPDGYLTLGVILLPMPNPNRPGEDFVNGFLLGPLLEGHPQASIPLDDGGVWTLKADPAFSGTGDAWVRVHPNVITAALGASSDPVGLALSFTPAEGLILLGSANGTRIQVDGIEISLQLSEANGGDAILRLGSPPGGPSIQVVVAPGQADGFLHGLLGGNEIKSELDLELSLSAAQGFRFGASPTLKHHIQLGRQLGPILFDSVDLSIGAIERGAAASMRTYLGAHLGPFSIEVDGLGLAFAFTKDANADGNLGPFDVAVAVAPPHGLGFAVTAPAVTGGGYLEFRPDVGEYSGALQLDFASVGLTAVGLLSLPAEQGDSTWSLLFALSLEFEVPLGFGFALTGVGGLIAVNRTFDPDALTRGVRTGAIGSLMFPPKPLNAPALIQQMDGYFPEAAGNFVIGPFARISWGVGRLVNAELGIFISIPTGSGGGVQLAVIGILSALLPQPEAPILELNMAVLGFIDFQAGTIELAASVYDSTLLRTIQLSGDMAMYALVGRQSDFLLAIGGFHPAWKPTEGVPARITTLKRLTAAIKLGQNIECSIRGYFAITSNTFQLGGRFDLLARAKFLGAQYRAEGHLGFDLLVYFDPFRFVAAASASFVIKKQQKELLGILLAIQVQGPKPWFGRVEGEFKFLTIKVKFRVQIGSRPQQSTPGTFPVRQEIATQLADVRNWEAIGTGGGSSTWDLVTLRDPSPEAVELLVRPDGRMEVRQRIAPLNQEIEIYGTQKVEGPKRTRIVAAGFTQGPAATTDDVYDGFAPAQYREMSDSQKLAAPSFEDHPSGVSFGSQGVTIDAGAAEAKPVTWEAYKAGSDVPEAVGSGALVSDDLLFRLTADQLQYQAMLLDTAAVTINATAYTVVDGDTGEIATDVVGSGTTGLSWMDASHLLQTASTDAHHALTVVPLHTAVSP